MRRLTALMLVLLLTSCSAAPAAEPQQANGDMVAMIAQVPLPQPEEEVVLSYQVESVISEDTAEAEDGTRLAGYRFDLPVLQVVREDGTVVEEGDKPQEEAALAVAAAFNEHFGKWAAAEEFGSLVEAAQTDLDFCREMEMEWFHGYELELVTSVYQTEHLVSVAGSYCSYTGGAHPNTWQLGWNFDLETGMFFGPEGLAADSTAFQEAIHQELIRQAKIVALENGMAPEEFFWEDYQEILANWSSYAVFFDEDGMTVAFSPYELACYAAGTQVFFVTYDWLRPHLSEHGCLVLSLE